MKNKKIFILLTLCIGILFNIVKPVRADDGSEVGHFYIIGGIQDVDYKFESGVLTILSDKTLTIKNVDSSTATTDRIIVPEDVDANLIFAGVNISTTTNSPFTLTPDSNRDGKGASAYIVLADNTINKLTSRNVNYPGLRCGKTTTVYIDDSIVNKDVNGNHIVPELGRIPYNVTLLNGTKLEKGSRLTAMDSSNAGQLYAVGNYRGAGIGGGNGESGGNIYINGGIIDSIGDATKSTAGYSAGIGGGCRGDGGNITINGGIITAHGSIHGAGVGGGCHSGTNEPITPAAVDYNTAYGRSGNITINGGLTYSTGNEHAEAFGDGCVVEKTDERFKIIMTGGTVIPTAHSGRYDLGGDYADVYVLGGSLRAERFSSINGKVAYGDMEKKTQVFMSKVGLESWGTEKVSTTLVDDMSMKINGLEYNYGIPSYTDSMGLLYFWLPDANKGAEVSVDLDVIDKSTGELLDTDTFFAKDVGNNGNTFLKQYINFVVKSSDMSNTLLTKRYDGLPLDDEKIKKSIVSLGIQTSIPSDGILNDETKLTIDSQLLKDDGITLEDNTEINSGSSANGGKYQLIITSTQYAESTDQNFKDAYWGHRAYLKYAEITPADTETILSIEGLSHEPNTFRPDQTLTLNAKVTPAKGEGIYCASPQGYVQFYMNGQKIGDPVELNNHAKDETSIYNYSTATIDFLPMDSSYYISGKKQKISVKYIGEDRNYTESQDIKEYKLDNLNIDTNGDGIPDINIDIDGDGIPDINIDTDNDLKPDINIDINHDLKPDINIDTDNTGTWKPSSEGGNADGIWKPDTNIDINGDGNANQQYFRPAIDVDGDGVDDHWKPNKDIIADDILYDTGDIVIEMPTEEKPKVNIDVDGDGIPDINIDTNGDGRPDINIDIDGDGKPDINIDTDNTGVWKPSSEGGNADGIWKPDTNIDTNGDGKGDLNDYRVPIDEDGNGIDDYWKPNKVVKLENIEYDTGYQKINIQSQIKEPTLLLPSNMKKPVPIKTGDESYIIQYCLLIPLSIMGIIYYKRKKKEI